MADTLSRIFGPANVANGTSTVFTGTANHVYSFRDGIRIVNDSTAAISIKLGIGGVADADLIMPSITIPDGAGYLVEGLIVLTGAQTLQAATSASGLTISGHGLDQV